jgi:diamine N-acetyltransferase
MIELRKISLTDDSMKECIKLEVKPEQREFVAHNAYSLATAYVENSRGGHIVTPYAIYLESKMIGFIMYGYIKKELEDTYGEDCYFFWRFMVDKKHQGKGYGRQALAMVIDEMKKMPNGVVDYIYTSYEPKNVVAKRLYEDFGFVETGQVDDGELVMRLKI